MSRLDLEHRLITVGYDLAGGGHPAVCSCGWRSALFSSAGLAGAAWDAHLHDEFDRADGRHRSSVAAGADRFRR